MVGSKRKGMCRGGVGEGWIVKERLLRSQVANIYEYKRQGWGVREAKYVFSSYDAMRKMNLGWRDDSNIRNIFTHCACLC